MAAADEDGVDGSATPPRILLPGEIDADDDKDRLLLLAHPSSEPPPSGVGSGSGDCSASAKPIGLKAVVKSSPPRLRLLDESAKVGEG
jgi:hypothetical protein